MVRIRLDERVINETDLAIFNHLSKQIIDFLSIKSKSHHEILCSYERYTQIHKHSNVISPKICKAALKPESEHSYPFLK